MEDPRNLSCMANGSLKFPALRTWHFRMPIEGEKEACGGHYREASADPEPLVSYLLFPARAVSEDPVLLNKIPDLLFCESHRPAEISERSLPRSTSSPHFVVATLDFACGLRTRYAVQPAAQDQRSNKYSTLLSSLYRVTI
jgi:hypothetical protein